MINRNGKVIVPVQYEEVNYPTEGMIRIRENGLYGFYDTAGNLVIKPQYRTTSGFSEGLAAAIVDIDSRWIGKSSQELEDEFGLMLVLVRRGSSVVKPTETYHVEVGDMLVLYYLPQSI